MQNPSNSDKISMIKQLRRVAKICVDEGIEIPVAPVQKPELRSSYDRLSALPNELLAAIFQHCAASELPIPLDTQSVHAIEPTNRSIEEHVSAAVQLIHRFGTSQKLRDIAIKELFAGFTLNLPCTRPHLSSPFFSGIIADPDFLAFDFIRTSLMRERMPAAVQNLLTANLRSCHLRLKLDVRGGVILEGDRIDAMSLISQLDEVVMLMPVLKRLRVSTIIEEIAPECREFAWRFLEEMSWLDVDDCQIWMGERGSMPGAVGETNGKSDDEVVEMLMGGEVWVKVHH